MIDIAELKPYMYKVEAKFKVVEKLDEREVNLKFDNEVHSIAEFLVGDKTAAIMLSVWDADIGKVREGKTFVLGNGYTSLFRNSIRLNVGKYGRLDESPEGEEVNGVNEDNNLSELAFQPK